MVGSEDAFPCRERRGRRSASAVPCPSHKPVHVGRVRAVIRPALCLVLTCGVFAAVPVRLPAEAPRVQVPGEDDERRNRDAQAAQPEEPAKPQAIRAQSEDDDDSAEEYQPVDQKGEDEWISILGVDLVRRSDGPAAIAALVSLTVVLVSLLGAYSSNVAARAIRHKEVARLTVSLSSGRADADVVGIDIRNCGEAPADDLRLEVEPGGSAMARFVLDALPARGEAAPHPSFRTETDTVLIIVRYRDHLGKRWHEGRRFERLAIGENWKLLDFQRNRQWRAWWR